MAQLLKNAMVQLAGASRSFAAAHLVVAPRAVAPRVLSTAAKASVGKRELVAIVKEKCNLSKEQAEGAVNAVLDTVVGTVAKGERVTIPGFGVFEARARAARRGRNPQTGAEIQIAETVVPAFSAGKTFKDTVKAGGAATPQ